MSSRANEGVLLIGCPPLRPQMPPLGVAMLAEWLSHTGWPVDVLDLNADVYEGLGTRAAQHRLWSDTAVAQWAEPQYSERTRHLIASCLERAVRRIDRLAPSFVGLSCLSMFSLPVANDLASRLKRRNRDMTIIGGGQGFFGSLSRRHADLEAFDYVVEGEGEHALIDLLRALTSRADDAEIARIPGVIPWAASGDRQAAPRLPRHVMRRSDEFPFPRFGAFDLERYSSFPLMASRGCIYRCRFCDEHARNTGSGHRPMNPEWALEAMRFYADSGIEDVQFADLLVNGDMAALDALVDGLLRAGSELRWSGCFAARRGLTSRQFARAHKAGLRTISVGVESLSDRVLKAMGAGYTVRDAVEMIRLASDVGIATDIFLLLGFPGERDIDVDETLRNLEALRPHINSVASIRTLMLTEHFGLARHLDRCGIEWEPDALAIDWTGDGENTLDERLDRLHRVVARVEQLGFGFREPLSGEYPDCVVLTRRSDSSSGAADGGTDSRAGTLCDELASLGVRTITRKLREPTWALASDAQTPPIDPALFTGATMAVVFVEQPDEPWHVELARTVRYVDAPLLLVAVVDSEPPGGQVPNGWDAVIWGPPAPAVHAMMRRLRAGLGLVSSASGRWAVAHRDTAPLPRLAQVAELDPDSQVVLSKLDGAAPAGADFTLCRSELRVRFQRSALDLELELIFGSGSETSGRPTGGSRIRSWSVPCAFAGTIISLSGTEVVPTSLADTELVNAMLHVTRLGVTGERTDVALLPLAHVVRNTGADSEAPSQLGPSVLASAIRVEPGPPTRYDARDYELPSGAASSDLGAAVGRSPSETTTATRVESENGRSELVGSGADGPSLAQKLPPDPSKVSRAAEPKGAEESSVPAHPLGQGEDAPAQTLPGEGAEKSLASESHRPVDERSEASDGQRFSEWLLARLRGWLQTSEYRVAKTSLIEVPDPNSSTSTRWAVALELESGEERMVVELSTRGRRPCMTETTICSVLHQGDADTLSPDSKRMLDAFVTRLRMVERRTLRLLVQRAREDQRS